MRLSKLFCSVVGVALSSTGAAEGIEGEIAVTIVREVGESDEIRQELSGRYWYDHVGRSRVELNGRTTIVDPVGGVHWTADGAGRAMVRELPEAPTPSGPSVRKFGTDKVPGFEFPSTAPDMQPPERTPLGTRTVEGFEAEGFMYRQIIPAGTWGNTDELVIESEVWSANLAEGIVLPLLSIMRSPLTGTTTSELRGIKVLSDEEVARRFRPSDNWTVLDTTPPEAAPTLSR